jgi:carbonic anhydrase/acetyltransferase-like protein (isoleucine patch superfamily)
MTIEERLSKFLARTPDISHALFVAPCARVMGAVTLGADSSVFYGSVLRGDIEEIRIGEGSNIQDGVIVHLADDLPAVVGDYCTVGHGAIVHACTIGDRCLIGMGATVLDGAHIGEESLVAAGAVVTPRTQIPPGSMVVGAPARVKRALSPAEREGLKDWAIKYLAVARAHSGQPR